MGQGRGGNLLSQQYVAAQIAGEGVEGLGVRGLDVFGDAEETAHFGGEIACDAIAAKSRLAVGVEKVGKSEEQAGEWTWRVFLKGGQADQPAKVELHQWEFDQRAGVLVDQIGTMVATEREALAGDINPLQERHLGRKAFGWRRIGEQRGEPWIEFVELEERWIFGFYVPKAQAFVEGKDEVADLGAGDEVGPLQGKSDGGQNAGPSQTEFRLSVGFCQALDPAEDAGRKASAEKPSPGPCGTSTIVMT
jgi:hypothetical protein